MATVKVTSEQLVALSSSLSSGSQSVQSQLDSMRKQLEPLVTDWEGAASATFQQLWQDWQTSARTLKESLDGIAQLLSKAGQTYQQAEDSVKGMMSQ
ncbi:MAG: WXG100 family type VII secretion target [Acidimicrobiales bacterium]